MYKSTAGHFFDATISREYKNPALTEYKSLNDPHLKSYFYRKEVKNKLLSNGFITKTLHVVVPLKEYNEYRKFLENEFLKLHQPEIDKQQNERKIDKKIVVRDDNAFEREEKRRLFFIEQQNKLEAKRLELKEQEKKETIEKEKKHKEKRKQQIKKELKREAEREQLILLKLEKESMEIYKRKKALARIEENEYNRLQKLQELKRTQKITNFKELQRKYENYEKHMELTKEEERKQKDLEKIAKEKRIKRRNTLFMLLQQVEEEKKEKFTQQNNEQVMHLKKMADMFEKSWQNAHLNKIKECRERLRRQSLPQKKIQPTELAKNHLPPSIEETEEKSSTDALNVSVSQPILTGNDCNCNTRTEPDDCYCNSNTEPEEDTIVKTSSKKVHYSESDYQQIDN
jgi:hypothetical protein